MMARQSSSGDLLADRRFAYAEALAGEGDHAAAADLLRQVLERTPAWAPAWLALGVAEERRGAVADAAAAYAAAAAHDVGDVLGAGLHAARLMGGAIPPTMPRAYVATLFDDYAPRFDLHLTEALAYRGPAVIMEALRESGAPARFAHVLDLGCGTGLMGRAIRLRAERLTGVDLSAGMVKEARRAGDYDALAVGDMDAALADCPAGSVDLVLAADVFVYRGALEPVLRAIARALRPGGILAFTTQRSAGDPVRLGPDLRFAHAERYLADALVEAGFEAARIDPVSTRREAGHEVPGLVVVARTH